MEDITQKLPMNRKATALHSLLKGVSVIFKGIGFLSLAFLVLRLWKEGFPRLEGPEGETWAGVLRILLPYVIMGALSGGVIGLGSLMVRLANRVRDKLFGLGDLAWHLVKAVSSGQEKSALSTAELILNRPTKDEYGHYLHGYSWFIKGMCSENRDFYEKALDCYGGALAVNPNFVDALNEKGVCYNIMGNPQKALPCFERILDIQSDDLEALLNKAGTLEKAGSLDIALDAWRKFAGAIESKYPRGLIGLSAIESQKPISRYVSIITDESFKNTTQMFRHEPARWQELLEVHRAYLASSGEQADREYKEQVNKINPTIQSLADAHSLDLATTVSLLLAISFLKQSPEQ